jgi:hypothetical protein
VCRDCRRRCSSTAIVVVSQLFGNVPRARRETRRVTRRDATSQRVTRVLFSGA